MGEQAVGRVVPTAPGPWHVEVSGVAIVVNVRARSWRGEPDGFMAWIGGEAEPYDVEHERFAWLAPVAPIGSVPPEVYARGVREAFDEGFDKGHEDYGYRWGSLSAAWDASAPGDDILATLTTHGLHPDEAARIVREVAS